MFRNVPSVRGPNGYCAFLIGDERFDECHSCGLLSHKAVGGVITTNSVAYGEGPDENLAPHLIDNFFLQLRAYVGITRQGLGILGKGAAVFAAEAQRRGFQADVIAMANAPARKYAVVAVIGLLEDAEDPAAFVVSLRDHIAGDGALAVITRRLVKPGFEAQSGRILGQRQRYSFSDQNLQTVLWNGGFDEVFLSRWVGTEDLAHAQGWAKDHAIIFGRMRKRRELPVLSIVVPVYNEIATVRQVLAALASKEIPGLNMEIVVVESSSTDGSREVVLDYKNHPKFKIVPRGTASRQGLRGTRRSTKDDRRCGPYSGRRPRIRFPRL